MNGSNRLLLMHRWKVIALAALAFCTTSEGAVDFSRDIAPILSMHCAECHGPNVQKGKVSLQSRAHAVGEADWKKAIEAGNPEASLLLRSVSGSQPEMPKKGPKLTADEVSKLREWIAAGAPWPAEVTLKERLSGSGTVWSLQPLRDSMPPMVAVEGLPLPVSSPVDAFINAKLSGKGLTPAAEADRRTLIRRLSFTLLGLPPSPDEVEAFIHDTHPDAWERLVDRYLASPHYGERWARHWLDIAHYADTHGFERDQKREHAWPYRDWVVRAFNSDMPYDAFIRQQIAGDVIAPQNRDAVIATGFLAAGPWDFVGQKETPSPMLKRQARADDLDDMVTQVVTSTLGLTINCARCHNHKLDPISQEDYYRLWAVFAGVTRGERDIDAPGQEGSLQKQKELATRQQQLSDVIKRLTGPTLDLADIVGGGDGTGNGKAGAGIDASTGKRIENKKGFLDGAKTNRFLTVQPPDKGGAADLIHGVVIPDGTHPVPVTSTGITVEGVPATSGKAWDGIRNGPVNAQASTTLSGVDYKSAGHSLLGLHANAAITFDLAAMRRMLGDGALRFTAMTGYGGSALNSKAEFHVFLDGKLAFHRATFGAKDGGLPLDVSIPASVRFLTLMSTDGGDGISHDQVFLGDAKLAPTEASSRLSRAEQAQLASAIQERDDLFSQLNALARPGKFYGVLSGEAPKVHVLARGSTEAPGEEVMPGGLTCASASDHDFGNHTTPEGERRRRLAEWLVRTDNPLTARVLVNRLWHHHFGRGLVDTPSDFGNGGGKPSHPELLDWLAREFMKSGWSMKHMHRLILTSKAYLRSSLREIESPDTSNILLARMHPRRLDAESLRDAVLTVSGCLNPEMGGPGYQDFDYQEAYAPIYKHITADKPSLWKRSIYRFIVRTTPQRFMTTLDCPDPANLTPARLTTTTALQSLALMNNAFMLQQSRYFAERVQHETGVEAGAQITRAFELAFQRAPDSQELESALRLVEQQGLPALCRLLFNANEFVHLD
ncbi:DUF1553 domain-containing protein [Roseimicrobium sp. ORNL1]|uniref:DUF1553 domain-containing protein n=1 Tax=Roseimicrobium sp. ORNL1 TaxID=2711231 RepID=UPI0013E1C418|nr:DUF1553 domain-containing protein [Roseimicrobium sp. ORNL1]QIF05197.1 DUF1553 domain-containing protein [Roseimicrobium sp. ORNL1]